MEEGSKLIIGKVGISVISTISGALLSFIISSSIFYEKVSRLEDRSKEIIAKLDKTIDMFNKARFEDMQNTTQAIATLNGRTIALEVNQNNFIQGKIIQGKR